VQPRRHRHGALGSAAGVPDRAVGAHGDDFTDARDGPPYGAEHLASLAERYAGLTSRLVDAVDQRAPNLLGEALSELFDGGLAQRDAHRAPFALVDDVLAGALENRWRDGLGQRLGDAQGDEPRSLVRRSEVSDDEDRHRLGQRVVQQ
jgi:hypothetical protein